MNRTRGAITTLTHPDVQTVRSSVQETHSASIPAEFKPAARRQARPLSGFTAALRPEHGGDPRHGKHFSVRRAKPFKSPSPPLWLPLTAPASASPLPTTRRVNVLLPLGPGRCQRVVTHCVRTSPAAQRSQSGLFHLKPASIVIQMLVDLDPRSGACPPSSEPP